MKPARLLSPLFFTAALGTRINGRRRGWWLTWRLRSIGGRVGRHLSVAPGVRVVTARGAHWDVGDRVSLGVGVIISVSVGASLTIGDDARINHYTVLGVEHAIVLGERAQVAEHCSVRDHDHDVIAGSMHRAPVVPAPVRIGTDAWVGRGCAVLRSSRVEDGAVVGANSVVRGVIPAGAVAAGAPARVVRPRREQREPAGPG